MGTIKESLTFDDVLLLPRYSDILPSETDISIELTKKIFLKVPFLSSAMDTVTESKMAIAMAQAGGIGIVHRNLNIKDQIKEIFKVNKKKLVVGAAVGTNKEDLLRAKMLIDNGCDLIVIDTAHGHTKKVLNLLSNLKKLTKKSLSVLEMLPLERLQKNCMTQELILLKLELVQDQFVPLEW